MIESFRALFAPPRHFILLIAAMWIGLTLAEKRVDRHGITKDELNNISFYSLIAFVIGGRLLFALTNLSAFSQSPLSIFSPNPDLFDPASGLIVALLVGYILGQRQNLLFWGTLDAVTPLLAMIMVGLSLSHLAAGTAFGSPTNLPWGIDLWNATRHPTQVYELIASLLIFGWLWLQKTDSPPGLYFLTFTALTAASRLFLEAFRGDSTLIFGEYRLAQIGALVVLVATLAASEMIRQNKKPPVGG
ncbi:MAG TPA: prolipoprotein diacylglyceryl transferase family protein [Anaerolineales bacterium]|nr:prolipoprotein diacylglyceryl transferase family protein [Anaerolineales bacterium]